MGCFKEIRKIFPNSSEDINRKQQYNGRFALLLGQALHNS